MKISWLVQGDIIQDKPSGILPDVIREMGHNCEVHWYKDNRFKEPFADPKTPVILYGSFAFIKAMNRNFIPGAFGVTKNADCTHYMTFLPNNWLLNRDSAYTTWGDFKNRRDFWYKWFANLDGYVFVRPDSGRKTFTGQTIGYGEHHYRCNLMDKHSSVHDTTLILVSKAQPISTEFRYFIVQNQVVASSLYQWGDLGTPQQDEFYVKPVDLKPQADALAEKVAKFDWQLDTCYSCDIAVTPDDGVRIVELNSFASAGFYDCDVKSIVRAVSNAALDEWRDDG